MAANPGESVRAVDLSSCRPTLRTFHSRSMTFRAPRCSRAGGPWSSTACEARTSSRCNCRQPVLRRRHRHEDDLRAALADGHELGCHTFDHLDGCNSSATAFERSIASNRAALAQLVPRRSLSSVCVPAGRAGTGDKASGRSSICLLPWRRADLQQRIHRPQPAERVLS